MTDNNSYSRHHGLVPPLLVAAVATALLTGCQNSSPVVSSPKFALTTVDAVVARDTAFPGNLVFTANDGDAIWDDVTGVVLLGKETDIELGPGEFTVERSDEVGDPAVGNIVFDIPAGVTSFRGTEAELYFSDGSEPRRVEIGTWNLTRQGPEDVVDVVEGQPIAMQRCGPATARYVNTGDDSIDVLGATSNAPGVTITAAEQPGSVGPGEEFELSLDMTCEDSFDLQVVSPRVVLGGDDGTRNSALPPISIGLLGLDQGAVDRIANR